MAHDPKTADEAFYFLFLFFLNSKLLKTSNLFFKSTDSLAQNTNVFLYFLLCTFGSISINR